MLKAVFPIATIISLTTMLLSPSVMTGQKASAPNREQAALTADQVTAFQTQRQRLHLESDVAYINSVSSKYPQSDETYGIPLSPEERTALSNMGKASIATSAIENLLEGQNIVSGIWVSGPPAAIHLATTRGLTEEQRSAVITIASGLSVVFVQRDHLYSDLVKISRDIVDSDSWDSGYLVSSGPDVRTGVVKVGIVKDAPTSVSDALTSHYGGSVQIVPNSVPAHATGGRSFTSGGVHGGEWINSATEPCTGSYFNVRNASGSGYYYGLTAGHCAASGQTVYRGHDAKTIPLGSMGSHNPTYSGSRTNCDCKQFGALDGSEVSNYILGQNNALVRMRGAAGVPSGLPQCFSGARTYNLNTINPCGYVLDRDQTLIFTVEPNSGPAYNFTLTDCDTIDQVPQGGDSGAPVYSGDSGTDKLYGIVAGARTEIDSSGNEIESEGVFSEANNISTAGVTLQFN